MNLKNILIALFLVIFIALDFLYIQKTKNISYITFEPQKFKNIKTLDNDLAIANCKNCNILMIALDTLRPDHIGAYGYSKNTTPYIDTFAEKSVIFENHYVNSATSAPSWMSIFTSLYPDVHQVLNRNATLADSRITITEILKDEGYKTATFHAHDPELSTERGYRNFDERFYVDFNFFTKAKIVHPVFNWLHKNNNEKFFIFLHSSLAHDPYLPLEPYVRIFDPDYTGKAWTSAIDFLELNPVVKQYYNADYPKWIFETGSEELLKIYKMVKKLYYSVFDLNKKEDLDHLVALYDAEIYSIDIFLKDVFSTLEDLGLYENTIVILTTDHGEAFLEHGNLGHENLYDENIRAALIMYIPGVAPFRVTALTQAIDIVPTLFDYLSIEPNVFIQGKSLVNVANGNDKAVNDYIFSEFNGSSAIRSLEYKLINVGENLELYNLALDPQELNNIISEEPKIANQMEDILLQWKLNNNK